jgi:preprotein translocase subunit YajC
MFDLLISNAHAQAAGAATNPIMNFVPIILVFVVFYFLMIKPQKKKMQQEQKFVAEMQKGEEVFTKSGMIGKIYGLTDKVVTLEVDAGMKIKFLRTQIAGSTKSLYETKEAPEAKVIKKK